LSSSPLQSEDNQPIRLFLADDNEEFLARTTELLAREFQVVGTAIDGTNALSQIQCLAPDLAVLDISMGDTNGIDLARTLRAVGYRGKIVFLSVHDSVDFVKAAIGAGGSAYVTKLSMGDELVPAIKAALGGGTFVSPSIRPAS
jgi:DNA-binding NarL/FixJ family response regulator